MRYEVKLLPVAATVLGIGACAIMCSKEEQVKRTNQKAYKWL